MQNSSSSFDYSKFKLTSHIAVQAVLFELSVLELNKTKPDVFNHIRNMIAAIGHLERENKRLRQQKPVSSSPPQQPKLEVKPIDIMPVPPNKTPAVIPPLPKPADPKSSVIQTKVLLPVSENPVQKSVPPSVASKTSSVPSPCDSAKLETKSDTTAPLPSLPKTDLQRSYLDAFLCKDTAAMKNIRAQSVRERDNFLSKKTSRENRKNNVVILNFPRDARINTKEQYIDFLISLDVLTPADRAHVREITQRDSKRTGKLLLTVSFDGVSDLRDKVLSNNHWSKNKYLPIWGISVFPEMTYQERLQQRFVCV